MFYWIAIIFLVLNILLYSLLTTNKVNYRRIAQKIWDKQMGISLEGIQKTKIEEIPHFYHYYLSNAGMFVGRKMAPQGIVFFCQLLSIGIWIAFVIAISSLFWGEYIMSAIAAFEFIFILFISNPFTFFAFYNISEEKFFENTMLNWRVAYPNDPMWDKNRTVPEYVDSDTIERLYKTSKNMTKDYFDEK